MEPTPTNTATASEAALDVCANPCEGCVGNGMEGSVSMYHRHIIITLGKPESWAPDVNIMCGIQEFDTEIDRQLQEITDSGGKAATVRLTACDCDYRVTAESASSTCIFLYPEAVSITFDALSVDVISSFVAWLLRPASQLTELPVGRAVPLPWKRLFLVCVHAARDKRCGRAGPQVVAEMQRYLSERSLLFDTKRRSGEVMVCGSSHVGGHKFAGTFVSYPEGLWFGRVTKPSTAELLTRILESSTNDLSTHKCFRGNGLLEW